MHKSIPDKGTIKINYIRSTVLSPQKGERTKKEEKFGQISSSKRRRSRTVCQQETWRRGAENAHCTAETQPGRANTARGTTTVERPFQRTGSHFRTADRCSPSSEYSKEAVSFSFQVPVIAAAKPWQHQKKRATINACHSEATPLAKVK